VIFLIFGNNLRNENLPKKKILTLLILSLVPNVYLKVFPIAAWFYSIWFSPKFNSHVYNLKRWARGEYIFLYFATLVQRGPSIGECCFKDFDDGPMNMGLSKRKKRRSYVHTHELINMWVSQCPIMTISFRIIICMQPMKWLNLPSEGLSFLPRQIFVVV
jgi:hypothetical protein